MADSKPVRRKDEIVVQEFNDEVLIYDLSDNRALSLNETSAKVWRACDGNNSVADITHLVGDEDVAWLALDQLKRERLIDGSVKNPTKFTGMSRREVVRKIAIGTAVAVPVVASLVAPQAAHAASCGGPCTGNGQCTSPACPTCSGAVGSKTCV
jgi:hypothetical protein